MTTDYNAIQHITTACQITLARRDNDKSYQGITISHGFPDVVDIYIKWAAKRNLKLISQARNIYLVQMSNTSTVNSPYPEGTLSTEHQAEIVKIRDCLTRWISATKDVRKDVPEAKERMLAVTEELWGMDLFVAPGVFYYFLISCRFKCRRTLRIYTTSALPVSTHLIILRSLLLACSHSIPR